MPELPEVETYRKYVESTSLKKKILKIDIDDDRLVKCGEDNFFEWLRGNSFVDSYRIGKYLFIKISSGKTLIMHFGLTGNVEYFKDLEDCPKYTRVLFYFDNGFKLAYICKRKFGWVDIVDDIETYRDKTGMGPDALKLSFEEFKKGISKRKTSIKPVLMDQKLTAGIGNIFADEILYQSRIHPETKVPEISDKDIRLIYDKMKEILKTAINYDANYDKFPENYLVHFRKDGGSCYHTGCKIKRIEVNGRGTYYSPEYQAKN